MARWIRWQERSAGVRYGVAVVAVVLPAVIALLLQQLGIEAIVSLSLCAVVIAALFGGLGPGLLAVGLSALAFCIFLMPPLTSLAVVYSDALQLLLFVVTALVVVALSAQQRSTAQSLRRTQHELQTTIDSIPTNVVRYRADGSLEFANQQLRTYTGLSLESLRAQRFIDAIHQDDRPQLAAAWRAHLASGQPFETEQRIRRADGEYRWFLVRHVPLRDQNGAVIRWYGASHDIDDQKRMAEALRKNESELLEAKRALEQTIDSIPVLASRYRPDGTTDFVNQAWRTYTGLSQESWAGRGSAVVHPDDRPRIEQAWAAHLAAAEPFDTEQRMQRADGAYRWYVVRRVPLRDDNGTVTAWYGAGHDIDDQKRLEQALRKSEAELIEAKRELQLMLDCIPSMVWRAGADNFAEYLNKSWLDYTGLSLEQALGWGWQATVHPDDLPVLQERWDRMMASGEGEEFEVRIRRHDGEYRWFATRRVPLRDEDGKVVRWYGTNIDIEDRKRAEAALRRSEAYLNEAQRLSVTGSFGWRVSGRDIVWSKEMYRIFDLDPSVAPTVGVVLDRTHPEDAGPFLGFIRRMAKEEADLDFEHRALLPGGIVKHLHMRTRRVQLDASEPEVVGALMDVTAARQAEDALQRARADLAHATRVATLGELSASIAHEVNQPLTSIVASGEAAVRWLNRETGGKQRALNSITRMIDEARRASEVIGRIRAFAQKAEPQMSVVGINDMIREVMALIRGEAFGQRVAVRARLESALPPARGDKIQLQQVLVNLAMNGMQAMASVTDRARELVIRTELRGADELLVAVEDVGIGMEPANLNRLFNAFYTTKPDGMGMGLSICRSIVQAHGGNIWATPNAGPGMTFQFTLSPYRADATAVAPA